METVKGSLLFTCKGPKPCHRTALFGDTVNDGFRYQDSTIVRLPQRRLQK
jgi:hypothetical protein